MERPTGLTIRGFIFAWFDLIYSKIDLYCDQKKRNTWMNKTNQMRYYASREWALLKRQIRERSGGMCERCGKGGYDATHHLTYERFGHEKLEDLQALCAPCHEFFSGKSDFNPCELARVPNDYWLEKIYAHPHPWIDHWNWTFPDPINQDSVILNEALNLICQADMPALKNCKTFFGVVPMGDFPGMSLWAARSLGCVARAELHLRSAALIVSFEHFAWISDKPWIIYAKHEIATGSFVRLIRSEDMTPEEKLVAEESDPAPLRDSY
jgi:hypothetical protein